MRITKEQLCGATVIVLITTFFYFGRFTLHHLRPLHTTSTPYVEKKAGSIIVELAGDTDHKGTYFVPSKTTVSDLFKIAKITDIERFNKKTLAVVISNGNKVILYPKNQRCSQVKIGEIDAAKKILLNIPIDINNATAYDLTLIPGIGKKTAQSIVGLRERAGGITSIDDLLKVRGMSKKRLAKIKKYLTVNGKT
jgi:competence protein ComEA